MFNLRVLNKYFVKNVLDKQDPIFFTGLNDFNTSTFLVQSCLSQEGQSVFHFDVLKRIIQTINHEKSRSDESENSIFYENVLNGASYLTCQTLLLNLFQYERVPKPCITHARLGYYDLISS